jgi:hypothetical protein
MAELDGLQNRTVLIMASNGMRSDQIKIVESAARKAFQVVVSKMTRKQDERGWPMSSNTLFLTCYNEIKRIGAPCFLWIEADCVPLKPGWIDQMEGEYKHCGKPFMGCVYQRPFSHLTGCAIYPNNIEQYNPKVTKGGYTSAWDVVNPNLTIAASCHTKLFQHVWGNHKHNIAPTFPNQASLKLLSSEAVLFHCCKDGSLIDRLRERRDSPKYCKLMAAFGSETNRFQDFEDHDWSKFKAKIP